MPESLTYSSLVTDLQGYLQRDGDAVLAQIPRFIMLAQQRIPRELKILGFREEVTGNFDANIVATGIMSKPEGWRKTIVFYVSVDGVTHIPVYERTSEYIRTVYPNIKPNPTSDVPRFYGDINFDYYLLGPAPYATFAYKIAYYSTLSLLDNINETNWLTKNAPDLLLYACLLEAVSYLKVDERIPVWEKAYDRAASALLKQEVMGLVDRQASTKEN